MNNLAIIPARGGSKRIPRKNIRDFLGKPIIAYSIESALESNLFIEVMVSTDDEEIAEIAKKYGAKIPFFRSNQCSDDEATTVDVIIEVLQNYQNKDITFDNACCIYPTAPLMKSIFLKTGYEKFISQSFDTLFPVVQFLYPIQRSLNLSETGKIEMNWSKYINTRSQDLTKSYHDAGQFYWFNIDYLKKEKKLFGDNSGSIVLSNTSVQDIDTEEDWIMAEMKARNSL